MQKKKKKGKTKESSPKAFDKRKLKQLTDTIIVKVPTPEWQEAGIDHVHVRSMTSRSRDAYEVALVSAQEESGNAADNIRANTVVATACDEDGNLIFDSSDAVWLGNMSASALNRIFDAGKKLAGITKEDVKDMEKSLGTAQN